MTKRGKVREPKKEIPKTEGEHKRQEKNHDEATDTAPPPSKPK